MAGGKVSNSQSGFVSMECAVGLARDKSGTFAYKFQRPEAIKKKKKNLSAGPTTAIIFLPRSGDEFQGFFPSGDLGGEAGRKWKVLGGTQTTAGL